MSEAAPPDIAGLRATVIGLAAEAAARIALPPPDATPEQLVMFFESVAKAALAVAWGPAFALGRRAGTSEGKAHALAFSAGQVERLAGPMGGGDRVAATRALALRLYAAVEADGTHQVVEPQPLVTLA